jgi:leader peptidase (prepilin peptidase)/N-methyltransferase
VSTELRNPDDHARSPSTVVRAGRIVALIAVISPLVRWIIVYYSVPAGHPWSRACPHCGSRIGVTNRRPLFAMARCGRCRTRVGAPPWSVEVVLVAAGAVLAWARLPVWVVPAYMWWALLGVVLVFVDLAVQRLPDRLTWAAVVGFLVLAAPAAGQGYSGQWLRAVEAATVLAGLLGSCAVIRPAWIGRGDVKYSAAVAAAAGWLSWFAVYAAMFVAALIAALLGIGLMIAGRASRRSRLPFGPFLFAGVMLVLVILARVGFRSP